MPALQKKLELAKTKLKIKLRALLTIYLKKKIIKKDCDKVTKTIYTKLKEDGDINENDSDIKKKLKTTWKSIKRIKSSMTKYDHSININTGINLGLFQFSGGYEVKTIDRSERTKEMGDMKELGNIKWDINDQMTNFKVLCIMDDIDRLNDEEIADLFKLVKEVVDFDNIVYLLSFDKKIVVNALNKVQHGNGEQYLNKIINVPFDVPLTTKKELKKVFLKYFVFKIEEKIVSTFFDDFKKEFNSEFIQFIKQEISTTNYNDEYDLIYLKKIKNQYIDRKILDKFKAKFKDNFNKELENIFKKNFIDIFKKEYKKKPKIDVNKFINDFCIYSKNKWLNEQEFENIHQIKELNEQEFKNIHQNRFIIGLVDKFVNSGSFLNDFVDKFVDDIEKEFRNKLGETFSKKYKEEFNRRIDEVINEQLKEYKITEERNSIKKALIEAYKKSSQIEIEKSELLKELNNEICEPNDETGEITEKFNESKKCINEFIEKFENKFKVKISNEFKEKSKKKFQTEPRRDFMEYFFEKFEKDFKKNNSQIELKDFIKKITPNYDVEQMNYILSPFEEFGGKLKNEKDGIVYLFDNVRDVKRYLNILKSNYNVIGNKSNFKDFLIITALQLFRPDVYSKIKNDERLFTEKYGQQDICGEKDLEYEDFNKILEIIGKDQNVEFLLREAFRKIDIMYRIDELYKEDKLKMNPELKYRRYNQKFNNNIDYFDENYSISSKKHFKNYFKLLVDINS